ncbi:MAG TPA: hypothetical protein VK978_03540 [Candidatus Saccharimonadales bacterium]|nr:hypothetical protein [Candidatus Saccharimonadales bacterium]
MALNEHLAPQTLDASTYNQVEALMVHQEPVYYEWSDLYDHPVPVSFSDQIAEISKQSPEAYLVTANSAVPVADSIRGYYDTLGIRAPYIGYIRADRETSKLTGKRTERRNEEMARLAPLIGGMSCVSIVEQFVDKGHTLTLAREILIGLNVKRLPSFEQSNWYHDADPDEINLANVTSMHADKMYDIGRQAAERNANRA